MTPFEQKSYDEMGMEDLAVLFTQLREGSNGPFERKAKRIQNLIAVLKEKGEDVFPFETMLEEELRIYDSFRAGPWEQEFYRGKESKNLEEDERKHDPEVLALRRKTAARIFRERRASDRQQTSPQ